MAIVKSDRQSSLQFCTQMSRKEVQQVIIITINIVTVRENPVLQASAYIIMTLRSEKAIFWD